MTRNLALDLALVPDASSVRDGLGRLVAMPPMVDLAPDIRSTAELVLAEVLNNIAEHAYLGGRGMVTVKLEPGKAGLCCEVVDHGLPMPDGRPPVGALPDATDLSEGGFGWYLIRSLTQDLHYERVDGQNRLSFVILDQGGGAD